MSPAAKKKLRLRIYLTGAAFTLFIAIVGVRAAYLQVYRGQSLSQRAAGQYEKSLRQTGRRGVIYDAKFRQMAVSIDVTSIAASPQQIENPQNTARALAKVLPLKRRDLQKRLVSDKPFVWVKRQVSPKEVKIVKDLSLTGIKFIPEHSRYYPQRSLAAQVLGFTGIDGYGLEGLEFAYNDQLKGDVDHYTIVRDALGANVNADNLIDSDNSGNNLVLTIDATIQYQAEKALADAVSQTKAKSGMVVVMNPRSGALLAMVNIPQFNPNAFADYHKATWRNRVITDPFEPGSTLKIFLAAAALDSGISTANTIYFCEQGTYRVGTNIVHDIKSHGWLSLQQIIKYSSNIGAIKVGEKLGSKALHTYLSAFGFGHKTGIDCPGETPGSLPHFKRWSQIDAGAIAFGQGIAVSALQLAQAVSVIANDGVMMQPYIVQAVTDTNGAPLKSFAPRQKRRIVSARTARTVARIMKTVTTEEGSGINAALDGYSVSGKTGTAQKIADTGTYAKDRYISSFVGFTPTVNPAAVIVVIIDEPKEAYYGGIVAAPVFRRIAHATLSYLNVPPQGKLAHARKGTTANSDDAGRRRAMAKWLGDRG
jgi:cell division protein FtsI (penicillin-binding protein 3)